VHQAAVADGREQARESEVEAKDANAQIAFVEGDGVAGTKEYVVKGAGIFAERGFVLGAAVEIVENGARETALGEAAKIFDVDDARRSERGGDGIHAGYSM
jgi:hypothetical protein